MEIYILRHGEAEERAAGGSDADRKLTEKGAKGVHRVVEAARRAGAAPQAILTSPLRRAQETAKIASMVLRCAHIVETQNLTPEAAPEQIWKELGHLDNVESVLLAGHEPHLSKLVAYLLGVALKLDFKKGALIHIVSVGRHSPPRGILQWMVTTKLARKCDSADNQS